jgi:hypothetical protein
MFNEILLSLVQKINNREDAQNVVIGSTITYFILFLIEILMFVTKTELGISDFLRDIGLILIGSYFAIMNDSRIAAWYLFIASLLSMIIYYGYSSYYDFSFASVSITSIGRVFCSIRIVEGTIKLNSSSLK